MCALAAVGSLTACGGSDGPGDPDIPAWSRGLPSAGDAMGARRGLVPARGIIHLHSPYSHDACDGKPRDETTGAVDEDCLADLRAALCDTRMDFAALTDHDDSMADESFETLFSKRGTDELVRDNAGDIIANRIMCPNGHQVLLSVGGENELMPIMLDRHPEGRTVSELHDLYNSESAASNDIFRSVGGIAWIAHAEQRSVDLLRTLAPDGFEIYQLHANIDPDIRSDFLGLSSSGAIRAVAEYADVNDTVLEPDLAFVSFVSPSDNAIAKWDQLLGEGMRVSGSGGTDAHQNALPIILRDGERGDSYRRMLRWFSNVALAADPRDPVAVEDAIANGRFFVAFEAFGTPSGFDAVATAGTTDTELGGELAKGDGATLTVTLPTVYELDERLPVPEVRARILRVDQAGVTELAQGPGPTISAPMDQPGAYRVEVFITPKHLSPYMGHVGTADVEREHVWIYANPIYVTE